MRGFLVAVMLSRSGHRLQGCVHFVNVYNVCILHIHKKLKSICPPDFEGKITQFLKGQVSPYLRVCTYRARQAESWSPGCLHKHYLGDQKFTSMAMEAWIQEVQIGAQCR